MREQALSIRDRGARAATPGRICAAFVQRHRVMWVIYAVGAFLLGHVGAFDTNQTTPWIRYPYFLFLNLVGGAIMGLALDGLEARGILTERIVAKAAVLALASAVVLTPVVWVAAGLLLEGSWRITRMTALFQQVLPVAAVFVSVHLLVRRRPSELPAATSVLEEDRPTLLDRLPRRLHGSALHALEAEDHYLRLHTDRGSTLILMPLTEAILEVGGLVGARTHRSWWVAKDAVVSATRGGGRAALSLKNGIVAPVSRTYAPALRDAGWF